MQKYKSLRFAVAPMMEWIDRAPKVRIAKANAEMPSTHVALSLHIALLDRSFQAFE